jgi:hypothetical protein
MDNNKKQIIVMGITSIVLSILTAIQPIIILLNMLTGNAKDKYYGYSLHLTIIIFLEAVPLLLSLILGAIAYSKYRENKKLYQKSKLIALLGLSLPITGALLIILDLLLDTFVF